MSEITDSKCVTQRCPRGRAVNTHGLCLVCYSKAKKKVEAGETTWEKLEKLGLCLPESDPFDDAYSEAMKDQ